MPRAVTSTVQITDSEFAPAPTVTQGCEAGRTATITNWLEGDVTTIETEIERYITEGLTTEFYETTIDVDMVCHYPSGGQPSPPRRDNPSAGTRSAETARLQQLQAVVWAERMGLVGRQSRRWASSRRTRQRGGAAAAAAGGVVVTEGGGRGGGGGGNGGERERWWRRWWR